MDLWNQLHFYSEGVYNQLGPTSVNYILFKWVTDFSRKHIAYSKCSFNCCRYFY